MAKRIGIIGSGRFGEALVQALAALGTEVVLMDTDRRKIQELSEYVSKAIEGDATNIHALEEAGFGSCDTVVVAIGENVEGSVMATVNCKDLGVRTVVAKASTDVHGRVLRRVGRAGSIRGSWRRPRRKRRGGEESIPRQGEIAPSRHSPRAGAPGRADGQGQRADGENQRRLGRDQARTRDAIAPGGARASDISRNLCYNILHYEK